MNSKPNETSPLLKSIMATVKAGRKKGQMGYQMAYEEDPSMDGAEAPCPHEAHERKEVEILGEMRRLLDSITDADLHAKFDELLMELEQMSEHEEVEVDDMDTDKEIQELQESLEASDGMEKIEEPAKKEEAPAKEEKSEEK